MNRFDFTNSIYGIKERLLVYEMLYNVYSVYSYNGVAYESKAFLTEMQEGMTRTQ